MVPARDRAILNSYVRLHFFRVSELSFPYVHRVAWRLARDGQ